MNVKFATGVMLFAVASMAHAGPFDNVKLPAAGDVGKSLSQQAEGAAKDALNKEVVNKVNKTLLDDGRKNQCAFKSGSDQLMPGCGNKAQKLANTLLDVKKTLQKENLKSFKFVVSGHTDTSGNAEKNKELSLKRAQVMVKELTSKGVDPSDIEAVGMGSEKPLVSPDDTPAKKAKNRRYEVQVRI